MKGDLVTVKSDCQAIRESQSTIIAQQGTITETVRESMTQVVAETLGGGIQDLKAQGGQEIQLLNQLLEKFQTFSMARGVGARVVEEVDDTTPPVNETPVEDILPSDELYDSVESILRAIRDKEGIFGLDESEDLTDALIFLLEKVTPDHSLRAAATANSPHRHWSETYTKSDLSDLRRNLRAVRGIIMSSSLLSVNQPG